MKKWIVLTGVLALFATSAQANVMKFEEMDTNKDGMVSKEEHADFAEKKFDKIDTNDDGKLNKQEMSAHQDEMMEKKGMKTSMKDKMKKSMKDSKTTYDERKAGGETALEEQKGENVKDLKPAAGEEGETKQ